MDNSIHFEANPCGGLSVCVVVAGGLNCHSVDGVHE